MFVEKQLKYEGIKCMKSKLKQVYPACIDIILF